MVPGLPVASAFGGSDAPPAMLGTRTGDQLLRSLVTRPNRPH